MDEYFWLTNNPIIRVFTILCMYYELTFIGTPKNYFLVTRLYLCVLQKYRF